MALISRRPDQGRGIGRLIKLPFASKSRQDAPAEIRSGQCFRERGGALWQVTRSVNFPREPLMHFELAKVSRIRQEFGEARKIVSVAALMDHRLFEFDGAKSDLA